ncbi:hypothetical protein [Prosthecobacter sp.]|uniref:hypothetical protein n=1 Tax=Prosthecobacter sp. TaxID=1965333 RepID=UPI003782EE77
MRRLVKLLVLIPLLLVGLTVAGVGVLFLRSDVVSFQPRLPEMRRMIEAQRAATPALPLFFRRCMHAEGVPDHHTARCLLAKHGLDDTTSLRRHARAFSWGASLWLHFSAEERDLLYCACVNDGAGKAGIHQVSRRLFGRPVEELTERELAALVVASRAPFRFLIHRPLWDLSTERLLHQVKGG